MSVTEVQRPLLREAYELVIDRWPDIIEPGAKTFHLDNGCNMRRLNEIHYPIERWFVGADFPAEIDAIIGSVEHYVFTGIHGALRNLTALRKADLDFEAFVSRFDGHPNFKVVSNAED
ncbi:hypothetical protein [Sphingomonas sp. HMP6]|uniref:hypothetical protein n=1 Tax=Sphingomonas sp. HMP6 TaxID=1517551 RepID=UPI0015966919|nr:hypothetical protein [Sphingomonas sp. HMP6]BCA60651.1 hypothetical protein HMP06_3420 [Sphingomonas sp. HMP6]